MNSDAIAQLFARTPAPPSLGVVESKPVSRGTFGRCYINPKDATPAMTLQIEIERETDGRWIAEVGDLSGVLAYGITRDEAIARVQALALRVIAERLEHAEAPAQLLNVSFQAA